MAMKKADGFGILTRGSKEQVDSQRHRPSGSELGWRDWVWTRVGGATIGDAEPTACEAADSMMGRR
jgi:hypothetical protein